MEIIQLPSVVLFIFFKKKACLIRYNLVLSFHFLLAQILLDKLREMKYSSGG